MSSFVSSDQSREAQVANWERHLTSIIEQTNNNIHYLSKSAKTSSSHPTKLLQHNDAKTRPPPPPPPPRLPPSRSFCGDDSCDKNKQHVHVGGTMKRRNHEGQMPQMKSTFKAHDVTSSKAPTRTSYYEQQAREAIEASRAGHGGGTGYPIGGVTRPLPKHVEDTLRRSILQSVKRSVEHSVVEKTHASQTRVDGLSDQCDTLSVDISKLRKEHGMLFRSIANQDRMTKRLKKEWDNQGSVIEKLESAMIQDMGWKESTAIDIKMLKDHLREDAAVRVTVAEMKNAMERISSKSMEAIERAMISAKNSFAADVKVLKEEMESLKNENKTLKEELRMNNEIHKDFEGRAKRVISDAVQCHFGRVEGKITQSVRVAINDDLKKIQEGRNVITSNVRTDEQIKQLLAKESLKNESEIHNLVSNIAVKKLDEYQKSLSARLLDSTMKALEDRASRPGDTFNACITKQIMKVKSEVEQELKNVTEECAKMKRYGNEVKSLVERKTKSTTGTKPEALKKVIELLDPRISSLERTVEECFKDSFADNKMRVKRLELECKALEEQLKMIESRSDTKNRQEKLFVESMEQIKKDVSLLHNVIEIKCKSSENNARTHTDAKLKEQMNDVDELQSKVKITQSCCETLTSSLQILKELSDRIDKLEEVVASRHVQSDISDHETVSKGDQSAKHLNEDEHNVGSVKGENNADFDTDKRGAQLREEVASQISTLATSDDVQSFKQDIYKITGELQERLQFIEEASTASTETSGALHTALDELKTDFEQLEFTCDRQQYNAEDLAACFGRISTIERNLRNEMLAVKGDLVDNVMSINSTSTERIDILVMEIRKEMATIKAGMSTLTNNEIRTISTNDLPSDVDFDGLKSELMMATDNNKEQRSMLQALDEELNIKFDMHQKYINEFKVDIEENQRDMATVKNDVKNLVEEIRLRALKINQISPQKQANVQVENDATCNDMLSRAFEESNQQDKDHSVIMDPKSAGSLIYEIDEVKPSDTKADILSAPLSTDDSIISAYSADVVEHIPNERSNKEGNIAEVDHDQVFPPDEATDTKVANTGNGLFVISENVDGPINDFDDVEDVENITTHANTDVHITNHQGDGTGEALNIADLGIEECMSSFEEESIGSLEDDGSTDAASDLISYSDGSKYDSDFESEEI